MSDVDDDELKAKLSVMPADHDEAMLWLEQRQAENRARRRAECEANGRHVLEMDADRCPHCGALYADVL